MIFRRSTARSLISAFLTIALGMALTAPYRFVAEEGAPGVSEGPKLAAVSQDHTIRGKTRVDLDYVFSSRSSHIEFDLPKPLPEEEVEEQDLEGFLESIEGNPLYEQQDRIVAPQLGAAGTDDESDFVGDSRGESGIGADGPVWEGTYSDTLMRTQVTDTATGAHPASARGTSFGNGYIPEYDEAPTLVDDPPFTGVYVDAENYSRLPRDWAVPPGGVASGGEYGNQRYYEDYPAYQYENTLTRNSNRGGYRYGPPGYSYDSEMIHHPEGPYSYVYGIQDPFWSNERKTFYEDGRYEITGGWPIFTRAFNPDDAHLKAGPFYLQVLSAEVGVLYSDYDGPAVFRPGEEDGWLGYSSLRMRAAARIAPDLYFTLSGEVIYLIGENELGFRSGVGVGSPFASLEYRADWGPWMIYIYDRLGTHIPFSVRASDGAYERAGHYSYGFGDLSRDRNDFLFDPVVYNIVGIGGTRPLNENWRIEAGAEHGDFFYVDSDRRDKHGARENWSIGAFSEPGRIPFSPYARYSGFTGNQFDTIAHSFYIGGSGRVSDQVSVDGRFGYFFQTGDVNVNDRWLWNVGIRHRVSERTHHGIRFGQDSFPNDFTDDSLVSEFFRYYLGHRFNDRLEFFGFAQWSRDEFLTGRFASEHFKREILGMRVDFRVSERTTSEFGFRTEVRENITTGAQTEWTTYNIDVNTRISERTTSYLRYQFLDAEVFDEDLFMAGVRRFF